tara:strand:+ start:251 stop:700 length:450 start_codon:yes stop_codon:yes gene_type:complete
MIQFLKTKKISFLNSSTYLSTFKDFMGTIFDISNICAGILLGISVLDRWDGSSQIFTKAAGILAPFRTIIGCISLILGIIYIFRPFCTLYDLIGILAGLTLLSGSLEKVPSIGDFLEKISNGLTPFKAAIGIAALVVGLLGLFNVAVLC